ncbi:hypothetical protein HN858_05100 [Candidatus Falkowbacteria bacterium]|nr:hypothetical protein [Candidatus Falkowbacteria bacterium]MBT5502587.1 hypothetical protein [Candidatus Falkowbacteria bacterium]MBT6574604.1 hypothetical protein [Candidatus Falkowbacteria bacterium]MBT7349015.1 hypothetical protein [Candidatus Falkowbacteria bacterium]MBT7500357.1 hypothetical protein [Candidatus Falkowbacteria bacterium]
MSSRNTQIKEALRRAGVLSGHSGRCTCSVCIGMNMGKSFSQALEGHSSRCTCSVCIRLRNPGFCK